MNTTSSSYNLDLQASAFIGRLMSTGTSDCQLYMTSGTNGKALIKATSGGVFYIQSTTSATAQDIQFYTSTTQQSLTLNAAGNAVFNGKITSPHPQILSYSTVPTIASNQVGYTLTGTSNSTASITSTLTIYQTLTLNSGVYIITAILAVISPGTNIGVGFYIYQGSSQLTGGFSYFTSSTSSTANTSNQLTCYVSNSTASQVYTLRANTSGSTAQYVNAFFQAVRIA
jgi:hypothetical protein